MKVFIIEECYVFDDYDRIEGIYSDEELAKIVSKYISYGQYKEYDVLDDIPSYHSVASKKEYKEWKNRNKK